MGLFSTSKSDFPWENVESISQLDQLVENSKTTPLVIFKHSTRCSISRMILNSFERYFPSDKDVQLAFLDLIAFRDVSNHIAESLRVMHQSPQVIVLVNGMVVHHASHENIDAETVSSLL